MLEHIRISNIRALKECVLPDLGKINVICGKNNSGKTTLLEGIALHKSILKEFKENDVIDFTDETKNYLRFDVSGPYLDIYTKIVRNALFSRKLWHVDDVEDFMHVIESEYRETTLPSRQFAFNTSPIKAVYHRYFQIPESATVLLPPKRHLDLSAAIQSLPVNPQGQGILNYLFHAKNQSETSEKWVIYSRISGAFTKISSGYSFAIHMEENNSLVLRFSHENRPWIDARDCGLGLQDLLVILYFSIAPQYSIILIEEPESHMHPDMQRKLLYFLEEETDKQFFLTTHSNIFLNTLLVDRIFFTYFDENIVINDATSRTAVLNSLGYTIVDNLVSDLIILVEGSTDIPIIEEFLVKFSLFDKYTIKIWPLGGDLMEHIDLSLFAEQYSILALIDSDPDSASVREKFVSNCEQHNIPITKLERYSIENYFTVNALKAVLRDHFPDSLVTIISDKKLSVQIKEHLAADSKINNYSKKKNGQVTHNMSIDDIKGTDLYDFFLKVEEYCKKNNKYVRTD